jgi:hypothetical protein
MCPILRHEAPEIIALVGAINKPLRFFARARTFLSARSIGLTQRFIEFVHVRASEIAYQVLFFKRSPAISQATNTGLLFYRRAVIIPVAAAGVL